MKKQEEIEIIQEKILDLKQEIIEKQELLDELISELIAELIENKEENNN